MEPVKEGPSRAIRQLGVRGDESATVHGNGQALEEQEKALSVKQVVVRKDHLACMPR